MVGSSTSSLAAARRRLLHLVARNNEIISFWQVYSS